MLYTRHPLHPYDAVKNSDLIDPPSRGIGIAAPDAVNDKTVFMDTGIEVYRGSPGSILAFSERSCGFAPVIEASCNEDFVRQGCIEFECYPFLVVFFDHCQETPFKELMTHGSLTKTSPKIHLYNSIIRTRLCLSQKRYLFCSSFVKCRVIVFCRDERGTAHSGVLMFLEGNKGVAGGKITPRDRISRHTRSIRWSS